MEDIKEKEEKEKTETKVEAQKASVPNPKKARAEGNRVAQAIKGTKAEFYVSDVDLDDHGTDVIIAADSVRKTLGKVKAGFMIISAGTTHLTVIVDIPNTEKISAKTWLAESLKGIYDGIIDGTDSFSQISFQIDGPFKLKDTVRATAFAYLRKCGLLEEESEEEEEIFDF